MHGGNAQKWGNNSDYTWPYRRWVAEQHAVRGRAMSEIAQTEGLSLGLISGWHGAYLEGHYNGVIAAPYPKLVTDALRHRQHASASPEAQPQLGRRPRRPFSSEYKREFIESAHRRGVPLAQAAREVPITHSQAYAWRKQYLAGKFGPVATQAHSTAEPQAPQDTPASPGTPVTQAGDITVRTPNGTVDIPAGTSPALAQAIIGALSHVQSREEHHGR